VHRDGEQAAQHVRDAEAQLVHQRLEHVGGLLFFSGGVEGEIEEIETKNEKKERDRERKKKTPLTLATAITQAVRV
jgi:hypothetical protein